MNIKKYLTAKQLVKLSQLDDTVRYDCVEDRQHTDWCKDCSFTIKGWVETALEWIINDSDNLAEDQGFINSLLEGGEQAIRDIDYCYSITLKKSGA